MDGLRSWIITLVTVVILCTIIEKFAPEGNLQKYVKLTCGLAVTLMISMPVVNLINSGLDIEVLAWNDYLKLSEREMQERISKLHQEDNRHLLEVYRQSLINDIKSRYMGESSFMVANVDAVLYEEPEKETFGMIRALYLILNPGPLNHAKTIDDNTISKMKEELSQVFSLEKDNIIIDTSSFNGGG
ncbi:MAG: stage III sporulation protein AF [Clostridiaceae bacterium]|nr:stage III sporulation protein AF [Clostridiaceae bacterium]